VKDLPKFDPLAGGPGYVYVKMADHITARITVGDLSPGARLPAERDLAEEYAVSLGTARRATAELRERGLVITIPVKGTYVTDRSQSESPHSDTEHVSATQNDVDRSSPHQAGNSTSAGE
jgi:DNA-binding GntR family transcriptional regulator